MATSQINPFEMPDYLNEARERVTFAFEEAVVFDKYLQLLSTPAEELLEACKQMMQDRSIDTAMGAQLDIIGRIVGQDRVLIGADLVPYFGYLGALLPESYGDLNNTGVGGYYWDINTPMGGNITLSDEQYRLFIKAKILKNLTRATPEDVIKFIQFVFEVEKVYISMDESAHAIIYVSSDISIFERALLVYFTEGRYRSYFVPKTLGVKYDYGVFEAEDFFGFFGVPGALGYGTLVWNGTDWVLDPNVGGLYASLITQ